MIGLFWSWALSNNSIFVSRNLEFFKANGLHLKIVNHGSDHYPITGFSEGK